MGSIKNPDSGEIHFSGIAGECSDSTISHCAVGKLTLIGQNVNWQRRITGPKPITHFNGVWSAKFITQTTNTSNTNTSTLKNNASIDNNPGNDDINGKDGKTVASALFKQRYFEHTLNWDFDTVWQWDDQENRPALRSVGAGATSQQANPAAQQANMVDLLTQQISANIWL
jgi:MoxR-like ATPase